MPTLCQTQTPVECFSRRLIENYRRNKSLAVLDAKPLTNPLANRYLFALKSHLLVTDLFIIIIPNGIYNLYVIIFILYCNIFIFFNAFNV